MRKRISVVTSMLLMLLLAACSSSIKSDVARFHALPQPTGETIVIVPAREELRGSLEFATYAGKIGQRLAAYGYKPAGGQQADLIVVLDYGVDDGKVEVKSYPSRRFGYGSPYYWGHYYPYGYYHPYHSYWDEPEVRSYVVYTRKLSMTIRPAGDDSINLFEGRVESRGRDNRLPEVMPYLIQALFDDFPGHSGATERVIIKLNDSDNQ